MPLAPLRYNLLYRFCACAAAVLALVLIMAIWHLGSNSMIACGFAGAFFIHVGTRPPRRELAAAAAAGVGFAACSLLLGDAIGGNVVKAIAGCGALLGLGSLAVMAWRLTGPGARAIAAPLRDALVLPVFSLVAGIVWISLAGWFPPTYDLFIYSFDSSLGIAPEATVAGWFRHAPWLDSAASVAYGLVLIFPPLYHAWRIRRRAPGIHLMNAFAVTGICGAVLYQVCPAVGPLYCFGPQLFPAHLPRAGEFSVQMFPGITVHNAMPSLHMTWALLVLWSAWELTPLARAIAACFAALTFLATLGFGEHYLADLIVAVPLALATEGICSLKRDRKLGLTATAAGSALTLGWLALLRTTWGVQLPIPVAWILVLGSTAAAISVEVRLHRGLRAVVVPPQNAVTKICEKRILTAQQLTRI